MADLDTLSEFFKIHDRHVHVGITSEKGLHKLYIDGSEVNPLVFLLELGVLENAHSPELLDTAKLAKNQVNISSR